MKQLLFLWSSLLFSQYGNPTFQSKNMNKEVKENEKSEEEMDTPSWLYIGLFTH